jgi:putative ABC transport system permease protein
VLSALGWRPGQTTRLFLAQALLLALGGGIVGVSIALLATTLLEAVPIWLIVTWTLPAMLVLALLSSLYPLWQLWRIRPAEILRAGSSVSSTASGRAGGSGLPLWSLGPALGALVLRNLGRSRSRTILTGISLFLSTVLLVLMFSGILALRQTLVGTLLGNFVLLQVRERQREIGLLQAVGWRTGQVQRLFVQEGLLLAILGTLPGVLVAQGILIAQHNAQNIFPPLFVALAAMLFMVLVAALAMLPALRMVSRMQVTEVLRDE